MFLCDFHPTDGPNRHRCRRCGYEDDFSCPPRQVRRPCGVVNLRAWDPSGRRRRSVSCKFLGPEVGRKECHGCAGSVHIKQFACAHTDHVVTTLPECASCEDYKPAPIPHDGGHSLLLRFPHGFGDAVQLTIVLAHLRAEFPRWNIDVACKTGTGALFAGLARTSVPLATPHDGYDIVRTLAWGEPTECHADSPSTKAEKCLREVFAVPPRPVLCRYVVRPDDRAKHDAARFAAELATRFPRRDGYVLIHHQGNSARRNKNVDEAAIAAAASRVLELGATPVLLDWDGRSGLLRSEFLVNPGGDHFLWRGRGTGDAGVIFALAKRARLCIGIDSGPGHLFGAEERGLRTRGKGEGRREGEKSADDESNSQFAPRVAPLPSSLAPRASSLLPPAIIIWTWHHPVHYYALSCNVTHLVPARHQRLLRGDAAAGAAFFAEHYDSRVYHDLRAALPRLVEEKLLVRRRIHGEVGFGPRDDPFIMVDDLWVRRENPSDMDEVIRDYVNDSCGVADMTPRPRLVVDLSPGIGALACRVRRRTCRAKIICLAGADEETNAVLKANAAELADICDRSPDEKSTEESTTVLQGAIQSAARENGGRIDILRFDARQELSRQMAFGLRENGALRIANLRDCATSTSDNQSVMTDPFGHRLESQHKQ